jgi:hypothetical protein
MQIKDFPRGIPSSNDFFLFQDATGVTKSCLFGELSLTVDVPPTAGTDVLTFQSAGDTNGVFYWIGTNKNTTAWQNPTNLGLAVLASSIGSGSLESLTDKQDSEFFTNSEDGSWVKFKLPGTAKLKCDYYSIKTRNASSDYYPRNWKLQGSNDDNTWVDLDIQSDNTTLISNSEWLSIPLNSNASYNSFKLLTTGINSSTLYHLVLGEVELYGIYEE